MKNIFQLLILLLITHVTTAQTFTPPAFADVDNNYRTYVNNVFGALETNRVPTGILADYGFDFTDPKIYNGSVLVDSTLMEQGIYSELYKTIFTSRFNNNTGTLRHPSVHDSLCYISREKEIITLSGLLFKFNAIDPNAQANGKMQTVNGQLKDKYVSGVWQNPYQEFNTVAISPSVITYKLTYCSVVLPSNLFLSNMLNQISSIQFDAGDGEGYRNIEFDIPLSLNYPDTGWKHWIFKVTLNNAQQLFSHSKVYFNNTSNVAGTGGGTASRGVPDRRRTITASEDFNSVFGVADIVISYRNENDQVLRRPLIVAEGFDPGWITSPEEPEGENSFQGFVNSVIGSGSAALQNLISGDPFIPNSASQYDLVYVNWRNGTDWLQRNALVLEEVIRWVNDNKQPLDGVMQPNVVLGSSMGGVIARMALGRMDRGGGQNGTGGFAAHQTSLYVSLDAPHQGANVPLGYQALARHATRMYISTGPIAIITEIVQFIRNGPSPLLNLRLADQPASRQLLINRIDLTYNPANVVNQQFLQELRTNWAYPINIRNIAISNGNECAIGQEFTPGTSLLYHYRSTKTRFIGDLIAMAAGLGLRALNVSPIITVPLIIPGSNKFELTLDIRSLASGGGNQVYYGNIKLTKKVLWLLPVSINIANKTYNAPSGLLPFDTYPGGFFTVDLANQPGAVSQDWMFSYDNSFFIQRRFTFVPTTSALDIGGGNTNLTNAEYTARYIGATPPSSPFQTPFQNFTTAYNSDGSSWIFTNSTFQNLNNEPHEGLFQRTANRLAAEMAVINPLPQFTNCSVFCSNNQISGIQTFCNAETFTAPFGNGVTYDWSVSNPTLINLNPIGNSVVATRNGTMSGQAILTVNITGACGISTLSIPIFVGVPDRPKVMEMGAEVRTVSICTDVHKFLCATFEGKWNVLEWEWEKVTGNFNLLDFGNCANIIGFQPGSGIISVRMRNACGWSRPTLISVNVTDCSGKAIQQNSIKLYPNPAGSSVNLSVDNNLINPKGKDNTSVGSIHEVKIYDSFGSIKLHQKYTKQQTVTLDISALREGVYVVEVNTGSGVEHQQLLIQK